MTSVQRWLGAGTTTITFIATGWILGAVLELTGVSLWVLRIGLTLLGAAAGFLVYRLLSETSGEADGEAEGPDLTGEIDEILSDVGRKLSAAGVDTGKIDRQPVVLFLGPSGSTKTSLVEEGGIEAELLAGEVRRGDRIAPTEAANVWLAGRTLLVEAGGGVLEDEDGWRELSDHLRPSRLAAVFGRGRQPPRTAVVCFPCDELRAAEGPDALAAAARDIRERLRSLARDLGIRLPVYTVFTRADRIPHFRPFVENLDHAEVRDVLGATLPPPVGEEEGAYADRQTELLSRHFDDVFRALARKRTELLARSGEDDDRGAIYEFPREFQKMRDRAVRFLVELCKPTRLSVSPFLRGFYFTGVRPVVAEEGGGQARPMESVGDEGPVGATRAFDAAAARRRARTPDSGGGRRVPQWVFVKKLFREIFLGDAVAAAVTAAGSRVNLFRRVLAGGALALAFVFLVGVQVSFFRNEGLQDDVRVAIERAQAMGDVETGRVTLPELRRLDTLGRQIDELRTWEVDGPPLSLRWGLYSGDDLLPPARRVFFDRFDPELGRATRQRLAAYLRQLPTSSADSAAGNYGEAYNALKAYLILTSNPERSSEEFLVPVLMEYWLEGREPGPEMAELARRQFGVYARELRYGNPYEVAADGSLVTRVRDYLREFTEVERIYQSMIARASREASAVRLPEDVPAAEGVLTATHTVPGAFTREGWLFVQEDHDLAEMLAREEWVTGGQGFSEEKLAELSKQLQQRYVADYVSHWRRFLSSVRLASYSSVGGAASSLSSLSSNRSPLLQLLSLVAANTSVDSARIGYAFQPVRAVAAPDSVDRYVVGSNRGYVQALGALQSAVEQVDKLSGSARGKARSKALRAAQDVEGQARSMAQGFSIDGEAQAVGTAVRELLQLPGSRAARLLERLPVAATNRRARQFCEQFAGVTSKFPFSPGAQTSATLDEVSSIFQPEESALWTFYDAVLSDLLVLQGSRYRARPDASARPTDAAVDFFNRAADVSRSLYGEGSAPTVEFILRLETSAELPEVSFALDGQKQTYTRTLSEMQQFTWNGQRAQYARITAGTGPDETILVDSPNGTWAIFRLFQAADWERLGGSRFRLEWPIPGRQASVRGELLLNTPVPILNTSYLAGLQCPETVVR